MPPELLHAVFADVRASSQRDLAVCTTVCRQWHPAAQYRLYQDIDIADTEEPTTRVVQLAQTLSTSFLTHSICNLSLRGGSLGDSNKIHLPSLSNLRRLTIRDMLPEDLSPLAASVSACSTLEYLYAKGTHPIFVVEDRLVAFISSLSWLPSLKQLYFYMPIHELDASLNSLEISDLHLPSIRTCKRPRLLSLDLRPESPPACTQEFPYFLDWMTDPHYPFDLSCLESLGLKNQKDVEHVPAHIRIRLRELTVSSIFDSDATQDSLSFPLLQHLQLDIPPKVHIDLLFKLDPPSLERVTLFCNRSVADSIYPSLRPLNVQAWKALDERLIQMREVSLKKVYIMQSGDIDSNLPGKLRRMLPRSAVRGLLDFSRGDTQL
uniref:F-box domain-containing protein n=1 Tax=Moniliophthora roreri TaxID=221103 RepID=A0A0W0FT17_MONRR